jgi:gluconate 2-dehydrogenase alpha chain
MSNTRLLLLSKIGQPYDPQTNTGVVGRNFTYQIGGATALGWYDDRILNRFMGSGANGYCIDKFNSDNFDHSGLGFFGGGNIAFNNTGARPIQSYGPLQPGTASRQRSSNTTTGALPSACRASARRTVRTT